MRCVSVVCIYGDVVMLTDALLALLVARSRAPVRGTLPGFQGRFLLGKGGFDMVINARTLPKMILLGFTY